MLVYKLHKRRSFQENSDFHVSKMTPNQFIIIEALTGVNISKVWSVFVSCTSSFQRNKRVWNISLTLSYQILKFWWFVGIVNHRIPYKVLESKIGDWLSINTFIRVDDLHVLNSLSLDDPIVNGPVYLNILF